MSIITNQASFALGAMTITTKIKKDQEEDQFPFPDEIIDLIGGFLEGKDLLNFSRVSKRIYNVCKNNYVFQNMVFQSVYKKYFKDTGYSHGPKEFFEHNEHTFTQIQPGKVDVKLLESKIRIYLRIQTEVHKDDPLALNKAYRLAHQRIKELEYSKLSLFDKVKNFVKHNPLIILSVATIGLTSFIRRYI